MDTFLLPHQPPCRRMAKTKYILRDFIATVPSCVQTTPLAIVVDMLSQGQSDRAVVLDQQQYPIGVLQMRRLMPQLMQLFTSGESIETKHLWDVADRLVEPVETLLADLDLEGFKSYLNSHQEQIHTNYEWALIDSEGKYVGLLESNRLWKILTSPEQEIDREPPDSLVQILAQNYGIELYKLDLLVQLLERLPLPLMLQTGKGEAIAQNPAWGQQFGTLSDPEEVSLEVEAILKTGVRSQKKAGGSGVEIPIQNLLATTGRDTTTDESLSHCKLGNQPGTCICSWPGQNGQDRVWQFLKIPLPMTVDSNRPEDEQIWLLLANDVTEQQQMASELAAKNADLIQLNRLKDEFLACISHELRTPLTAMLGLSTLLKDQALGQLNERQVRYARLIHENGRHLMSVVNDILDLTRMETGQMELTLEPVGIRKVCDRAIEQARAAMQPKTNQAATLAGKQLADNFTDHRFTLLIEPGLERIVADELRLRQMLVHLLANAFKFTELGGEIGLRVSSWAGWIAFTVWDTGIGIPEHQQHLIFQKFQQLENPLSRQFEGTGLGLVLTRALARLHGGDVSFLSQEGKGSQFTLLLPPNPPNKRAGGAGEAEGAGGAIHDRATSPASRNPYTQVATKSIVQNSSRHLPNSENRCNNHLVLVVEAAPRFIEELTEQLTSLGYWVVVARSGTEALEKARRLQPGAILLNPLLPLLSGWDVLTLIKSDAATNQIPVIVTTTRAEKDQAFSNCADEFLSLPVKRQVLQKLMTHFCGPPLVSHSKSLTRRASNDSQMTILRLLAPNHPTLNPQHQFSKADVPSESDYSLSLYCRVLEADDLEQASLLARIWHPDVVLLDGVILEPLAYLQKLAQHHSLAELPIVTLDAATAQTAKQQGLSVFPCLSTSPEPPIHTLLSVLQMAAGINSEYSVLVVDVASLEDLQQVKTEKAKKHSSLALRVEWLQALLQYLHTAGFRGVMSHSWGEVQQQIQQQGVDLLMFCLEDSKLALSVSTALTDLSQQYKLPPVVVMERQFSQSEVREQYPHYLEADEQDRANSYFYLDKLSGDTWIETDGFDSASTFVATARSHEDKLESLESVLGAIATKILPSSLSMEELLDNIHQILLTRPVGGARKD